MAYNFQDIDPENMDYKQQSDEARKRRLAAAAAIMGGGTFTDALGQFATSRATEALGNIPQLPQQTQPVAPVAPQEVQAQQPQQMVQAQQPQEIAQPITPEQLQQPVQQTQLPQPSEGVQVAGPTQLAPQPQPQATWMEELAKAGSDQTQLAKFMASTDIPEARQAAGRLIAQQYNEQKKQQEAQAKADKQLATGDLLPLMKEIQKERGEGSYLKAYLYGRLGLNELAKDEQQKLGAGRTWQVAYDSTGNKALMEVNAQGLPMRGFNEKLQELTPEQFGAFAVGQQPKHAFQMPSVHGSPVQRTNPETGQVETGMLIYDPISRTNYVQVGSQRKDTTGWNTMSQTVQNVFGAAQAGAAGKAAGEGFTPQPLQQFPGVQGQQPQVQPQVQAQPLPGGGVKLSPAQGQRVPLDQQATVAPKPSQFSTVQPGGAIPGLPAQAATGTVPGATVAQQRQNLELEAARQKEGIQVAGARSQAFNKILDEEVRPQAQQGDTIVSTRKQQFQIFDRPGVDTNKLFGLYNAAQENPNDQKLSIVRDIFGGMFKPEAEVSQRLAQLNLSPEEKSALMEYNIANAKINAATLKQTAGAGSVSDAEQKANREMNVDPTKIPALGAYNAMAQSQFEGDKARYKADWAATHPATNALQLDKAWRAESSKLTQMYTEIAKQRAKFITENGATTQAVKEGYKRYPIPEYDPQTESWKKTKPLAQIFGK